MALVWMFCTSDPAPGSVIPIEQTKSPAIIPGKYLSFKVSEPYFKEGNMPIDDYSTLLSKKIAVAVISLPLLTKEVKSKLN